MKFKKDIYISFSVSVVAHLLFFAFAARMFVPAMRIEERPEKKLLSFVVKTLNTNIPKRIQVNQSEIKPSDILKFENPSAADVTRTLSLEELAQNQKPEIQIKENNLQETAILPEIKELEDIQTEKKFDDFIREKTDRKTRPSLLKRVDAPEADTFVSPQEFAEDTGASEDFFDKMPGFTPQLADIKVDLSRKAGDALFADDGIATIQRVANFSDYKEFLVSHVAIYEDPMDRYKYYKISIRIGKDGLNLKSIPKEIIFLIDCSISMEAQRLEEFKKGVAYALNNLNPQDKFNIFTFKKSITKFKKVSVPPTSENLKEALAFVENLTVGEKTDTFLALSETINFQSQITPSYIILISDGRPTKGVTNSRLLINQISLINNGKKSIFAFTGGARVNRYLLDFIAYKNRGWTEYSYRTHEIEWYMANMYEKIRNPILSNIRYNISGLENPQMFPKMLPDIFKNTEFTLYGRFLNEKKFLLRILGDANGKTSELNIESSLATAEVGTEDIAKSWAFNKIYYLIGLLRDNSDNQTVIKEINFLCNKFNIKTPYSGNLGK